MSHWIATLAELDRAGESAVLVTVVTALGSTPREAGTKMVVTAHGLHGTIGGGQLEYEATEAARALLRDGAAAPLQRDYPLGPALGQCCGGHTTLLYEPVRPVTWRIALFGAGHVGRAIVKLLADLPCRVTWIDTRADAFPDTLPGNVTAVSPARPEDALVTAGAQALIMTHSHAQDYDIAAALLAREDLMSVGLIGSDTKRARFVGRMARAGIGADAIARLRCPIGLPGIDGKLPAEIAIAVVGQLLAERDAKAVMPEPAKPKRVAPAAFEHSFAGSAAPQSGIADCAEGCDGCANRPR
jgi:xanthine dehydrogenase accessory factor